MHVKPKSGNPGLILN